MTDLGFGQFLSEQIRVYAIVGTGAAPYLHHDLWRAFFSGLIVSNGERCLFYTVLGSDEGGNSRQQHYVRPCMEKRVDKEPLHVQKRHRLVNLSIGRSHYHQRLSKQNLLNS